MKHSAELLPGAGEKVASLLVERLPERAATEAALRRSEARYRALFMTMKQGFCLLEKVATPPGEPSDYRYLAVNQAFAQHTGLPDATGKTLRQLVPGVEPQIVAIYDEAVASGEPRYFEDYVAALDVWIAAEVLPDPQPGCLVVLFSNVSARHQAEQALQESEAQQACLLAAVERTRAEAQFCSLVAATSDTVYSMSPDWRQMHLLLGKKFLADPPGPSGSWINQSIPVADQPRVQAAVEAAIQAKAIFELEHRVILANGQVGWVYSRAIPALDAAGTIVEWLGAAQDVTARKQAEAQLRDVNDQLERQVAERTQALQESRSLLHAIAETQTASLSAFRALRDEHGRLTDLEFLFANTVATAQAGGRPLVGQRYRLLFPEAVEMGLWEVFGHVIETGELAVRELAYTGGSSMGWVHVIVTRLGDGLLVCSQDITARKQAEHERAKALQLLEQSEEVAKMGSWDYELATGRVTWSAGMYRLYGLAPGHPTPPLHYRDFALEEDRLIAERLLSSLRAGTTAFEETLRLRVGSDVKTVCVQAMLLPGADGQPERVLGVDLDISAVQRLEAENQALRFDQQQALLLAILQAQEAERNRLAEGLHNGLGQLLYAIKLQMSQLDVLALHSLPALDGVRSHVGRLLSEAINQTRTLAHELMPIALAEQGLDTSLRAICRSLTTAQLQFTCQLWLDEQVLPPPLQTALYRLAQELAHNVAKHADASRAVLEFEMMPGWVNLRAEDNGRGFDPAATSKGLGLRLLHDAVSLLGGTMLLDSSPEYGTHIRLRIPISS